MKKIAVAMAVMAVMAVMASGAAMADTFVEPAPNTGNAYGAGANEPAPSPWSPHLGASNATAYGPYATANGFQATSYGSGATAGDRFTTAIGAGSMATRQGAVAVGNSAAALGLGAISLGTGNVQGTGSIYIGNITSPLVPNIIAPPVKVTNAIGVGTLVTVSGDNAVAIGSQTTASGPNAVALGANSVSAGAGSIAIGGISNGNTSVAIGSGSYVSAPATASLAIGNNSQATAANSVALGAGSMATRVNSVEVGGRQITGVAAGTQATDAVNLEQLQQAVGSAIGVIDAKISATRKYAARGVAASLAIPTPIFGAGDTKAVAVTMGQYDGEMAIGAAMAVKLTPSLAFQAAISSPLATSVDAGGTVAARGGVSFSW